MFADARRTMTDQCSLRNRSAGTLGLNAQQEAHPGSCEAFDSIDFHCLLMPESTVADVF